MQTSTRPLSERVRLKKWFKCSFMKFVSSLPEGFLDKQIPDKPLLSVPSFPSPSRLFPYQYYSKGFQRVLPYSFVGRKLYKITKELKRAREESNREVMKEIEEGKETDREGRSKINTGYWLIFYYKLFHSLPKGRVISAPCHIVFCNQFVLYYLPLVYYLPKFFSAYIVLFLDTSNFLRLLSLFLFIHHISIISNEE